METRDHLFYNCGFSKHMWESILRICFIVQKPLDWDREFLWAVQTLKGKSFSVTVFKLPWLAHPHYIWIESNARWHNVTMEDVVYKLVVACVRARVT